jgi:hypothetical protein
MLDEDAIVDNVLLPDIQPVNISIRIKTIIDKPKIPCQVCRIKPMFNLDDLLDHFIVFLLVELN